MGPKETFFSTVEELKDKVNRVDIERMRNGIAWLNGVTTALKKKLTELDKMISDTMSKDEVLNELSFEIDAIKSLDNRAKGMYESIKATVKHLEKVIEELDEKANELVQRLDDKGIDTDSIPDYSDASSAVSGFVEELDNIFEDDDRFNIK